MNILNIISLLFINFITEKEIKLTLLSSLCLCINIPYLKLFVAHLAIDIMVYHIQTAF